MYINILSKREAQDKSGMSKANEASIVELRSNETGQNEQKLAKLENESFSLERSEVEKDSRKHRRLVIV